MTFYLKKYWKINSLVILLQIFWGALYAYSNVTMMRMMQAIMEQNLQLFIQRFGIHLGMWLVIICFDGLREWAKSKAKSCMNHALRADMAATLLDRSYTEFHTQRSGEYLSWFTNDVNAISVLAWDSFYGIISVLSQVAASIIALAQLHWSLLAVSAVIALIMLMAPKFLGKSVKALSEACSEERAQATSKIKDLLAGMDVLQFFGRTIRFMEETRAASDQMEGPQHKLHCTKTVINKGMDLVSIVCQMAVNCAIAVLSIKGIIMQSALMGGGNLCGTIYNGLSSISQDILSVQASEPYFRKITVHADTWTPKTDSQVLLLQNSLAVEGLSFSYGEKRVLDNISFCFEKGGKYALTGPSGCGKSTLLKLLLGRLPDYTGMIQVDGRNIKDFSTEQLQRQMGYIEQDVFLFNTTIRDNITLGLPFQDELLETAIRDSALESDLVNMPLGLDTLVGENGSNLSGGQKQRVAIARALIHNRSILLVDEGTSALDQRNADLVEQCLLSNPDLTLILVSHHLSSERRKQFTQVYELKSAPAAV